MKLDVGCGHYPKGDVNIDLYVKPTQHRSGDQRFLTDTPLNTKEIPNFVQADACHLPFRNDCFDEVVSHHTIEHVSKPLKMLKEIVRVTKINGLIIIVCPHRYAEREKCPMHKHMINIKWLDQAFKKCGVPRISAKERDWRYFPHNAFPWFRLPVEIELHTTKVKANE